MELAHLELENVGPFASERIELQTRAEGGPGVTFITGENGTGKSIVIDAIRATFGDFIGGPPRDLANGTPMVVTSTVGGHRFQRGAEYLNPGIRQRDAATLSLALDYWDAGLSRDTFALKGLQPFAIPTDHEYLRNALAGRPTNQDVTRQICLFDYLRDSRDPEERKRGEEVWALVEHIVRLCVPDGELAHVRRATFEPVIRQHGTELLLQHLSAGSLYGISRMLRLLERLYVTYLATGHTGEVARVPAILLVDEPENHLHPKWQKRFLRDVLAVFPNTQIVAATHSPFVVGSVAGARVLRCRVRDDGNGCTIEDVSEPYVNQTVDEVLASEAFAGTPPYSVDVQALVDARREAILNEDDAERERLERELSALNPEAFGAFRVTELLRELAGTS
ncbi:MAG: ATP-binding protein [Alphaproteobacteria bacterium]|nr:ATP-binding protein [Alphaproteobacteria bacterium]MCB9693265.1 ATP-binding protein [Alphaproteobacteria bacterium]